MGRGCSLLGKLDDGTEGCLGHNNRRTPEGLTQTEFCQGLDCLSQATVGEKELIKQKIQKLPRGKFKMSQVLTKRKASLS